jgi:hypothetical protein
MIQCNIHATAREETAACRGDFLIGDAKTQMPRDVVSLPRRLVSIELGA